MNCEAPIWIEKRANLQRGVEVPCGKCIPCLEQRRSIWTFRIMQELEVAETARFVTLTYDTMYLRWVQNGDLLQSTLVKKDIQNFIKKCRREILKENLPLLKSKNENLREQGERYLKQSEKTGRWSPKLRYFCAGEYGDKGGRAHYHIIIFNIPLTWYKYDPIHEEEYSNKIEEIWNKGLIHVGEVERASAHYTAKYTIKSLLMDWDENDKRQKPFAIMSRNPGIGANYINDETRNYFINSENYHTRLKGGYIQPIGRYYKEKIYEKEKISNGLSLRNEHESRAKRKTYAYAKRKEESILEHEIGEQIGDIEQSEKNIRERRRENFKALQRKTRNNLNKKL